MSERREPRGLLLGAFFLFATDDFGFGAFDFFGFRFLNFDRLGAFDDDRLGVDEELNALGRDEVGDANLLTEL